MSASWWSPTLLSKFLEPAGNVLLLLVFVLDSAGPCSTATERSWGCNALPCCGRELIFPELHFACRLVRSATKIALINHRKFALRSFFPPGDSLLQQMLQE